MAKTVAEVIEANNKALAEAKAIIAKATAGGSAVKTQTVPAPKAADPENTDTPPAEDEKKSNEDEDKVSALTKRIDDLEGRIKALEDKNEKANDENAKLSTALEQASGALTQVCAMVKDPAHVHAYAAGVDPMPTNPGAAPKAKENYVDIYCNMTPGPAANAYYKAHAADIEAQLAQ